MKRVVEKIIGLIKRIFSFNKWLARNKEPKMIWGYRSIGGVELPKVRIGDTVIMYHKDKIDISNHVFIGHYSILDGVGGITIGEGSQISAGVYIFTHSSHVSIRLYGKEYTRIPESEKKAYQIKQIDIGKYVFIGIGAKILPGARIGDYALIAAGSVVNTKVAKYSIVQGNPAKVVGDVREMDDKYLKQYPELKQTYVIDK